jgi:hypothetical protein
MGVTYKNAFGTTYIERECVCVCVRVCGGGKVHHSKFVLFNNSGHPSIHWPIQLFMSAQFLRVYVKTGTISPFTFTPYHKTSLTIPLPRVLLLPSPL